MFNLPAIDMKKNQPQILLLAVLVSVIALVLYVFLLIWPQAMRLAGLLGKTAVLSSELKSAELDVSRMEKLKGDISSYESKVELYEKRLPAEREIPRLLEDLSDIARQSNVMIVGITPVAPVKDEKGKTDKIYQELPILVSAKSSYHELGHFLSALESADRFMKVVDIEIRSDKTTHKMHNVELMVCTYILLSDKVKKKT